MVRKITSEQEFTELVGGETLVLVDFYANWCYPCRKFQPTLASLEREFAAVRDKTIVQII